MKIAIIGCGKMGSALVRGISLGKKARLILCDRSYGKAAKLAKEIGAEAVRKPEEAARKATRIILAVKPDEVEPLLLGIRGEVAGKLMISIAAGLPVSYLRKLLPKNCRVAVAMPSLASRIGRGATMFYAKTGKDRKAVIETFGGTGVLVEAKDEKLMDAAFLHSSGIAFFLSAIEGMARAGKRHGLKYPESLLLSAKAAEAAGALVLETKIPPLVLEEMVAAKKGITVRGLGVLRRGSVQRTFFSAGDAVIKEAKKRRRKNSYSKPEK